MNEVTMAQVAAAIGGTLQGDGSFRIRAAAEPASAGPDDLALAMDPKFLSGLTQGKARAAVLPAGTDFRAFGLIAAVLVSRPRFAMSGVTNLLQHPLALAAGIHPSAVIDPSASIGPGAAIGPFVVIGPRAVIGANARIMSHVSIGADARLGADALLYDGVRIGARVIIGDRFIAQPNAVIGGDGFSFVTPEKGAVESVRESGIVTEETRNLAFVRIHSLGSVVIGDDVEVGSCATIDRGTIANTTIGHGTRIDNIVQIGHNVRIGDNCLLCAHVGIAGSTVVGNRVVLGGKVGVADHAEIGDDAVIMASSGVSGKVKARSVMFGTPATPRDEQIAIYMAMKRLPRALKDLSALKKRIAETVGLGTAE